MAVIFIQNCPCINRTIYRVTRGVWRLAVITKWPVVIITRYCLILIRPHSVYSFNDALDNCFVRFKRVPLFSYHSTNTKETKRPSFFHAGNIHLAIPEASSAIHGFADCQFVRHYRRVHAPVNGGSWHTRTRVWAISAAVAAAAAAATCCSRRFSSWTYAVCRFLRRAASRPAAPRVASRCRFPAIRNFPLFRNDRCFQR